MSGYHSDVASVAVNPLCHDIKNITLAPTMHAVKMKFHYLSQSYTIAIGLLGFLKQVDCEIQNGNLKCNPRLI